MRQSWETMTSVSSGHIILTPTQPRQPVGSGRPQRESNPEPPHQESRALPTELKRNVIVTLRTVPKICVLWKLSLALWYYRWLEVKIFRSSAIYVHEGRL